WSSSWPGPGPSRSGRRCCRTRRPPWRSPRGSCGSWPSRGCRRWPTCGGGWGRRRTRSRWRPRPRARPPRAGRAERVAGATPQPGAGPRVRNPLVVALDRPDLEGAEDLARRLEGAAGMLKVGLELFCANGPAAALRIRPHGPVFLDLKLHDIPTTVGRAARVVGGLGAELLTVHALGGEAMVAAAV